MNLPRGARLGLTLLLALYGLRMAQHPDAGSFMDSVDLPIHEAGHIVFGPFGEFVGFAGGTLFQLIMPAAFIVYFLRQADRHAASVALWWVGQNFWNISVYAADARAQDLPLVGGGEHDWAYMLGRLHWLQRDQQVSKVLWTVGVVVLVASTLMGVLAVTGTREVTALEFAERTAPGED